MSGNLENNRVAQVACGLTHTFVLTEEGQVYAWGNNNWGQLCTGSHNSAEVPAQVSGSHGFDCKIVAVACGELVSFALDTGGNVQFSKIHDFILWEEID